MLTSTLDHFVIQSRGILHILFNFPSPPPEAEVPSFPMDPAVWAAGRHVVSYLDVQQLDRRVTVMSSKKEL